MTADKPIDPAREAPGTVPEFDPDRVLFHGGGLLVVDKPAGVPINRGTDHRYGVVEILGEWVRQNPGVLDVRPGRAIRPVHWIDREATGVLVLGLTRPAARRARQAFAGGGVRQSCLAVLAGPVPAKGELRGRVRSKLRNSYRYLPAALSYRKLRGDERLSLVEVLPQGNRPHQIRALFAQASRPLAGDLRFGRRKPAGQFLVKFSVDQLLLHAREAILPASVLGAEKTLAAAIPETFRELCQAKGWEPL